MQVWDLGGQANMRPSWVQYYKHTDAIIMVIDSTDRARISIVKVQLDAQLLIMASGGKGSQGLSDIAQCKWHQLHMRFSCNTQGCR